MTQLRLITQLKFIPQLIFITQLIVFIRREFSDLLVVVAIVRRAATNASAPISLKDFEVRIRAFSEMQFEGQ